MKWLTERISYHRHDEYTTILISSKVEKWKESLLFGWLMLWLLVGITIIYVLISGDYINVESSNDIKTQTRLFLILFLVFWAYFAYRISKVYFWRRNGVEYLKLNNDSLLIKRAFGKFGKAHSFNYNKMRAIELIEHSSRSFATVMGSSFWDISNESIQFDYQGKMINFGIQLTAEEAKKTINFINSEIKKRASKKKTQVI